MDEHRIGLKPIVRGVWAPVGERPIALGHHRFEWLYVAGFVEPVSRKTMWNVSNVVCKEMFELILARFCQVGGGRRQQTHHPSTLQRWLAPSQRASASF